MEYSKMQVTTIFIFAFLFLSGCSESKSGKVYERNFVPGPVQVFGLDTSVLIFFQFDQIFVPEENEPAWDYPTVRKIGHRQWFVRISTDTGEVSFCELIYPDGYGVSLNKNLLSMIITKAGYFAWKGPSYGSYSTVMVFDQYECSFRILEEDSALKELTPLLGSKGYAEGLNLVRKLQEESGAKQLYLSNRIESSKLSYDNQTVVIELSKQEKTGFIVSIGLEENEESRAEIEVLRELKRFSSDEINDLPRSNIGRRKSP